MKREQAIQHLLKFAEDNKYKSDEMGFLSGLIRVALRNPWHKVSEELPKGHHRVLVRVGRKIDGIDHIFYSCDIGMVDGGRWRLDSQDYSPLPYSPTIDSGLITHWMEIPELPKEEGK